MFNTAQSNSGKPKTISIAFALTVLLVLGCVQSALADQSSTTTQLTTKASSSPTVARLPHVTDDMANPSYWSSKQTEPDTVLADRALIDQLNLAGVDADGTMLQPLKAAAERFYTAEEQQRLKTAAQTEMANVFIGQVYDENDVLFTQEYADRILANYPTDGQAPDIASGYAIVTKHTTMRCYPTDQALMYTQGDYDDDNLYLTALRVNEPLLVRTSSVDGKFLLCISSCMQASWVPAEDVAICKDRDEWLAAWDIPAGQELVVVGYKVRTEQSRVTPNVANRMLYMGTVLERVEGADPTELVGTRSAYNNHVCYLPVRNEDGTYSKELALIAESENVSAGYLPLTKANIAKVAFRSLGQMYGWGGMLEANDCSGYVRDVYKCFGLELARNTTWQMNMPVRAYDLSQLDDAHKAAAIAQMPLGTVLFWGGHEMIYLGQENGMLYVISATGSIGNLFGDSGTTQVKGVVINTLDMVRGNRNTWLQTLTKANIPYIPSSTAGPSLYDIAFYENGITWPDSSYAHTGSSIEPPVSVPGLVEGEDYTVTYENNVDPGVATVTVAGAGSYLGSASHVFEIEPAGSPDPEPNPREIESGLYVLLNYTPVPEGQETVFTALPGGVESTDGLVYAWEESTDAQNWSEVASGSSPTYALPTDTAHLGHFIRVNATAPDGQTAQSNIQMLAAVVSGKEQQDSGNQNGGSLPSGEGDAQGNASSSTPAAADAGAQDAARSANSPRASSSSASRSSQESSRTNSATSSASPTSAASVRTSAATSSATPSGKSATSRTGDDSPLAPAVLVLSCAALAAYWARRRMPQ